MPLNRRKLDPLVSCLTLLAMLVSFGVKAEAIVRPESECGLMRNAWLTQRIDDLEREQSRVVTLEDAQGESMVVQIEADKIDFPERNVVYLAGFTQLKQHGNTVSADELVYDKEAQVVEARGMVRLSAKDGDVIETSQLLYDIARETAAAEGEVRLMTTDGDLIKAVELSYDLQRDAVRSGPAEFVFASRTGDSDLYVGQDRQVSAYGRAQSLSIVEENMVRLFDVEVTSCLDGRDDMRFTADEMLVNLLTGDREAVNAKVTLVAPEQYSPLADILDGLPQQEEDSAAN